ncbi:EpsG family protein [Acinetobacter johnsonii]|nr:EpsG family protein [Acinetobacter johnsonii]
MQWNKSISFVLSIVLIFSLSVMPGFRALSVGTDTLNYQSLLNLDFDIFQYIAIGQEPAFSLILTLVKILGVEDYYFLVVAVITNTFVVLAINRMKGYRFLVLFSYLTFSTIYFASFNIVRQCVAVAIFLLAFTYLIEGNKLRYILLILLATCFHYTSFFLFIFIFVDYLSRFKFLGYFFSFIIPFIINIFSIFFIYFASGLLGVDKLTYSARISEVGGRFYFIMNLFCIGLYFLLLGFSRKNYLYISLLLLNLSFLINISFLGMSYEGVGRLVFYTNIIWILAVPAIMSRIKRDERLLFVLLFVLLGSLHFLINVVLRNMHEVLPYYFV